MDLEERIMMAIVRISESYKKRNSALFKQNALTFSQYNVLRILEAAKGKQGGMSLSEISGMMLVSGANMTGIARRLENAGYISRKRMVADERVKLLSILPAGRVVLKDIKERKDRNNHLYLDGFSDNRKMALHEELIAILKAASVDVEQVADDD